MQIIEDRRALHRIPELELNLPKTIEYLKNALSGLKCDLFSPIENSLCAYFDFGKEETLAFRADCDALPIQEVNQTDYVSCHAGKMHACGHDGHMAILLELARRLNEKEDLPHNVLLIFQPGEESPGGAKPLCDTGVLAQHKVKTIFGLHLWPQLEKGVVFSRENELMSHASEITVDIYGKSSHISKASDGIDATAAAVEFYRQIRQVEQSMPPEVYRLLNFGMLTSGTVRNALSAHARLEGSVRAFHDHTFNYLQEQVYAVAANVEAQFGCTVQVHFADGYPAVINDPELVARVRRAVPFCRLDTPSMASEDFSQYQKRVGGVLFFLGTGNTAALHATTFNFNEEVLLKGADFFEQLAENFQ